MFFSFSKTGLSLLLLAQLGNAHTYVLQPQCVAKRPVTGGNSFEDVVNEAIHHSGEFAKRLEAGDDSYDLILQWNFGIEVSDPEIKRVIDMNSITQASDCLPAACFTVR